MDGKRREKDRVSSRVLCIGLDGATFDLIKPWIAEGRLPNLKRLLEEGVHSNLNSVIPPLSPQAWSSFMTGVNPGKHGLFGFKYQKKSKYEFQFTNNNCIKVKTLWKLLSEKGKKVITVNVPFTYPPEEINGIMVSGLGTPGTSVDFTYPPHFKEEVLKTINDYTIHLHVWGSLDNADKREKALKELLKMTDKRVALCKHLMSKYPWDFFMIVFTSIDQVQHHFWKYLESNSNFRNAILSVYEKNDDAIGSLLKHIDENTTVVIMSDHGAGKFSGIKIHIDEVLKIENLLFLRHSEKQPLSHLASKLTFRLLNLTRRMKKILIKTLSTKSKDTILRYLPSARGKVLSAGLSAIDWSKTKVYPGENVDFLRVNLKGELPYGIVEPGQNYEELINFTKTKLENLRHPDTGEQLIEKVYRKEDLYHGPYLHEAPDLIVWTKDYQHVIRGDLSQRKQGRIISVATDKSDPSGTHRLNGIFIVSGKHIKKGCQISSANIMDAFPTILHIMGYPIPTFADGKVLAEIFDEKYLRDNPISYIELNMDRVGVASGQEIYSDEEKSQIETHLKNLGYFE